MGGEVKKSVIKAEEQIRQEKPPGTSGKDGAPHDSAAVLHSETL